MDKIRQLKKELSKFEVDLDQQLDLAVTELFEGLPKKEVDAWVDVLLDIINNSLDATPNFNYLKSYIVESPRIFSKLPQAQFLEWVNQSSRIYNTKNNLGLAYVESTYSVLEKLSTRNLLDWGNIGLSLYRSDKYSEILAQKFYKFSPLILAASSYQDLAILADTLSRAMPRSSQISTKLIDWVHVISNDELFDVKLWNTILNLVSKNLANNFEVIFQNLVNNAELINKNKEFLNIAIIVLEKNPQNFKTILEKSIDIFNDHTENRSNEYVTMMKSLISQSYNELKDFSVNFQSLSDRVSSEKFKIWFDAGLDFLIANNISTRGYFSLEQDGSRKLFNELTFSVDLENEKEIMNFYCCALSGENLEVQSSQLMVDKEIGWINADLATTEGTTIYLPNSIKKFKKKDKNFSWLKVIATHQVGHVEFGTFKFKLSKPSEHFNDTRFKLVEKSAQSYSENTTEITDMTRFFKLFEDRKLAQDIFSIFEAVRVDSRVLSKYRGIARSYSEVQENALESRPKLKELPGREMLVEALIKYSLKIQKLMIPKKLEATLEELITLLNVLRKRNVLVEDTAEATIRAYKLLMSVENNLQDDFVEFQFDEKLLLDDYEDLTDELLEFYDYLGKGSQQSEENSIEEADLEDGANQTEDYKPPQEVEFWGDFKPELSQLLLEISLGESEFSEEGDLSDISKEQLEEMLRDSVEENAEQEGNDLSESDITQDLEDALNDLQSEKIDDDSKFSDRFDHFDEQGKPLEALEENQYVYDEWDFRDQAYKKDWCLVNEKKIGEGDLDYYEETLIKHAAIVADIKRQFELINPETYRKVKRLEEGEEQDLDLVVEAMVDLRVGVSPSEKLYWRRNKTERSISVAFLLDMSASTAEAIDDTDYSRDEWSAPDNPEKYMEWLRKRRSQGFRRSYKRIVDLEKEGLILLLDALEALGDTYGIFGFSGYGRENVEYFIIKDLDEKFSPAIPKRIDRISPLHATRMGPAIRHCTTKLLETEEKSKFIFLISDGRPQDRGYSREGVEKEYAVNDTKKALLEAKSEGITTFCLTVDKEGHDYMKSMMEDLSYEVLDDISSLPLRIPQLYKNLTAT